MPEKKGLLNRAIEYLETSQTSSDPKEPTASICLRGGLFIINENIGTATIKKDPALTELIESIRNGN